MIRHVDVDTRKVEGINISINEMLNICMEPILETNTLTEGWNKLFWTIFKYPNLVSTHLNKT